MLELASYDLKSLCHVQIDTIDSFIKSAIMLFLCPTHKIYLFN